MRWQSKGKSRNLEDRRGGGGGGKATLGGGAVIMVIVAYFLGIDPEVVVGTLSSGTQQAPSADPNFRSTPEEEELVGFVSWVLDDVQDVWTQLIRDYPEAKLVLFRDEVYSACGMQGAATGPFYCPADQKAYIDLSFYQDLRTRFKAPGDFAQAYVIAHEIGHHIQHITGANEEFYNLGKRYPKRANEFSVRQELQADCYAGVWGHYAKKNGYLEAGDLQEGLTAAAAIGDDTMQKRAGQKVRKESFTHGSSEQRQRWFKRGFDTGDPDQCDTMNAKSL